MELAYVCEWEKRPKSTHCPSIPLVCSWSCRNLVAFTTDLKSEDDDKSTQTHTRTHTQANTQTHAELDVLFSRCESHDPYHRH